MVFPEIVPRVTELQVKVPTVTWPGPAVALGAVQPLGTLMVNEPVLFDPLLVKEIAKLLVEPAITVDGEIVLVVTTAARYGPTNGPPFPVGGAPAGSMNSVFVSTSARARLIRP